MFKKKLVEVDLTFFIAVRKNSRPEPSTIESKKASFAFIALP